MTRALLFAVAGAVIVLGLIAHLTEPPPGGFTKVASALGVFAGIGALAGIGVLHMVSR